MAHYSALLPLGSRLLLHLPPPVPPRPLLFVVSLHEVGVPRRVAAAEVEGADGDGGSPQHVARAAGARNDEPLQETGEQGKGERGRG